MTTEEMNLECPVNDGVFFREGHYTVTNLKTEEERFQAHRLRYRIFSQELKWITSTANVLDTDEFDDGAIFFGVHDGRKNLIAFLRLILPGKMFMLEKTFPFLAESARELRKNRAAELSRLCIAPDERNTVIRGEFGGYSVAKLLYKGVYQWCIRNGIRYLYFVTEHKVYRLMRGQGFPCTAIGRPVIMPDGIVALSAEMDWKEFEKTNAEKRPGLLRWFTQD